jgi:hypothetical protein
LGANHFLPLLRAFLLQQCDRHTKGAVMPVTNVIARFAKAIATFASVAAAACGLFAFSWVGLALLGF